jgi:hypothetical protein
VLLTSIIDANEGRDVAVVDIPNAFIQTRVSEEKDSVHLRIAGKVVEWLVQTSPEVYSDYVYEDK